MLMFYFLSRLSFGDGSGRFFSVKEHRDLLQRWTTGFDKEKINDEALYDQATLCQSIISRPDTLRGLKNLQRDVNQVKLPR